MCILSPMIKKKRGIFMDKISNEDLIEQVKLGNETAFEELYQRFHKLAYFFAYQLCKNDADAKDILQDTFVEIHRSISSLKENSYFKAWMYRIVNSKCSKLFRKNKYVTNDFENDALTGDIREERMEFNPAYFAHFKNDQEVLYHFIQQLSASQRAIVVLFYLEEMSLKEISECLDVPLGTVKSRLSYGRTYLKKEMDNYYKNNDEKLTFHSLDTLIASTLTGAFSLTKIPVTGFGIVPFFKKARIHFIPACVVIGSILTVASGGILLYENWQNQHPSNLQERETAGLMKQEFHPVNVHQEVIDNPQDAYFTLQSWACCDEMIIQKSQEDIQNYQLLYQELKQYGGSFYDRLVVKNWSSAFEKQLEESE